MRAPNEKKCRNRRKAPMLSLLVGVVAPAAIQLSRGQLLAGLGGCVAAVPFACEAYARAPPSWRASELPRLALDDGRSDEVVIVLHGAGGPDANTRRIAEALEKTSSKGARVIEYVYAPYVGDQLQAPFNAMRVGDHLAEELAKAAASPKRVHVVGVSVGAFAADRLASRLAASGKCEQVRLTLLDPFTARGILGLARPESAYGVTEFGRSPGVRCESVFNRDDPVPSTNLPLRHAVNFDVTEAAERGRFTPLPGDNLHSWPAAWFGMHPTDLDGALSLTVGSVTSIK